MASGRSVWQLRTFVVSARAWLLYLRLGVSSVRPERTSLLLPARDTTTWRSDASQARRAKHDVPPCNRAKNPVTGLSKVTFYWTFTPFEVIVLGNFTLDGIVTGLLRGRTACNARRDPLRAV